MAARTTVRCQPLHQGRLIEWYRRAVSFRPALVTIALSTACTAAPPHSPPAPAATPEPPAVIVEDPDPPSGEIAGFTMTSLGRGLGRIAWPMHFTGQFDDDDREIRASASVGDLHYSV